MPKTHTDMVAAVFRTIFAQPDAQTVAATWDEVRDQLAKSFPKIGPLMDDAEAEVLAFSAFPRAHWSKIWSTNHLEGVNKKIKRRARVVGIFPNDAAVIRLVGAVLGDMHDEWQSGDRRYLSEGSMALLKSRRRYWHHRRDRQRRVGTEDQPSKPTTPRGTAFAVGGGLCVLLPVLTWELHRPLFEWLRSPCPPTMTACDLWAPDQSGNASRRTAVGRA